LSVDNSIDLRRKYNLDKDYIISVGTLQPRKNFSRLIQAYRTLDKEIQQNFDLILVGRKGWCCDDILEQVKDTSFTGSVRWLEYVPDHDLLDLVKGSTCLAFPSLAEGFGLPVLEGFAAKVPVLTSNVSSLPEVAGGAALLVDPYDVEAISDGLRQILDEVGMSEILKSKGDLRVKEFSWKRVTLETVDVYKSVV
jgi:glycosyltransferase involved in cell wall biosynthesis